MKNPLTTITGIISLVIMAITIFGLITQEEAGSLTQYASAIVEAVLGIIALFSSKDELKINNL